MLSQHGGRLRLKLKPQQRQFSLQKYPIYMKRNMFNLRISSYILRGNYILTLPVPIMPLNNGTYTAGLYENQ